MSLEGNGLSTSPRPCSLLAGENTFPDSARPRTGKTWAGKVETSPGHVLHVGVRRANGTPLTQDESPMRPRLPGRSDKHHGYTETDFGLSSVIRVRTVGPDVNLVRIFLFLLGVRVGGRGNVLSGHHRLRVLSVLILFWESRKRGGVTTPRIRFCEIFTSSPNRRVSPSTDARLGS